MGLTETSKRMRLGDAAIVKTVEDAEREMASLQSAKLKQQELLGKIKAKLAPIIREAQLSYDQIQSSCEAKVQAIRAWWLSVKHTYKTKSIKLVNGKIGDRLVGGGYDMPDDKVLLALLEKIGRNDLIEIITRPNKPAIRKDEKVHAQLNVVKREGHDEFFAQIEGDPISQFVALFSFLDEEAK